jgi:hypothetical protein
MLSCNCKQEVAVPMFSGPVNSRGTFLPEPLIDTLLLLLLCGLALRYKHKLSLCVLLMIIPKPSLTLLREGTIPIERRLLVGEANANFCG